MTRTPPRRSLTLPVIRAAAIATALLFLSACATQGSTVVALSLMPGGAGSVELNDTPFFPAKDHQNGPAALATMLGASGVTATPAELASLIHLPRHDSLQAELQELPPKYERLSYQIAPELAAILVELAAHRPVLVLQDSGASLLSKWHFAVVIGYDVKHDTLVLRSGTKRRQVASAREFMTAWSNADFWAMLVLRPGELPSVVSRERYLAAAADFERGARPEDAVLVFDAALKRWPDEPSAWIGRAAARRETGDLLAAARDYTTALRIDGSDTEARNSLALTLLDLGCIHKAQNQIDQIREAALPDPVRTRIEGSRDRITARSQNLLAQEPASCAEFAH